MEETEESNTNRKCYPKTRGFRGRTNPHSHQYHQQLFQNSNRIGFCNQNQYQTYPALLPLPPILPLQLTLTPPLPPNQSFRLKTHFQKPPLMQSSPPLATSSDAHLPKSTVLPAQEGLQRQISLPFKGKDGRKVMNATQQALVVPRRPDSGGKEGLVISLLANHFLVRFDPSQRIFHYDVEISPNPSKEIAPKTRIGSLTGLLSCDNISDGEIFGRVTSSNP